jgi:hypothetical protein
MKTTLVLFGAFALSGLILIFVPAVHAREVGFEIGNNLQNLTLSGHLQISCAPYLTADSAPREYECAKTALSPAAYSRFQTDFGNDADELELTVMHEDGWWRSKSSAFDGLRGISTDLINLWETSIFDWAVLDNGKNSVSYVLKKNRKPVRSGSVDVNVEQVARTCAPLKLVAQSLDECTTKRYACARYFFESNLCESSQ